MFRLPNVVRCFNNKVKLQNSSIFQRCKCSTNNTENAETVADENPESTLNMFKNEGEHFRYLLRNSQLINMGDPEGKVVIGTIFHVVKDDLYVDFGWKFYCVCPRPSKLEDSYVRGAKVFLRIKDLELSTRFIGNSKDLTLLEADGTIVGLLSTPFKRKVPPLISVLE